MTTTPSTTTNPDSASRAVGYTRLTDHTGEGLLSHDPDGLADRLLGVMGAAFGPADEIINPASGPYSTLLDPLHSPHPRYAAQWWGGDTTSWARGTAGHLTTYTKHHLTGSKTVHLVESPGGYDVTVITFTDETPGQIVFTPIEPAGYRYTHQIHTGWTWHDLANSGLTWQDTARYSCTRLAHIVPGTPLTVLQKGPQ